MTNSEPSVVFLHSIWRARSTYVFGRFRATNTFCCYYEPLNEALSTLDPRVKQDQSKLGHSPLEKGYWWEYEALLAKSGQGIEAFESAFAFHPFDSTNDPGPYLSNLIAKSPMRNVLLQPCRSPFRLAYLANRFPGAKHYYLERNLDDQYSSYNAVRTYFLSAHLAYAYLQPTLRAELDERFPDLLSRSELPSELSATANAEDLRLQLVAPLEAIDAPTRRSVFEFLWTSAHEDAERTGMTIVDGDSAGEMRTAFGDFGVTFEDYEGPSPRSAQ